MAKAKSKWRRALTTRFLRWWIAVQAVRLVPPLGNWLGFFPNAADMIEAAEEVLADEHGLITATDLGKDWEFLGLSRSADSADPSVDLSRGVVVGRRTATYDDAWIDATTGSILLPRRRQTVLVRGERVNWNAGSIRLGRPRVEVPGLVMPLLNTSNYFHVLMENGVRVLDLLDSGLLGETSLTLLVPQNAGIVADAFFDGLVRLYPQVSVKRAQSGTLVVPKRALMHFPRDTYWEWPPVDKPAAKRLAQVFEAAYGPAPDDGPNRLYITRDGAKLRQPAQAAALQDHLCTLGFQAFTATGTNHRDQIARFRAADVVVGTHGAGLTNLIFCRPGTRVVEIFPGNFIKSTYWWLSRQLGLIYQPVYGGPGDYTQRFEVDIAALDEGLARVGVTG